MSLILERKVYGTIIGVFLLILLALITCTCNGVKLTLANQIIVKPIDYSTSFGKPVKPTFDLTGCVILRTDDPASHSWRQVRLSTLQPYPVMRGTEYCPSPVPMRRKCSPTKWCLYPSTIRSSSNQYKTVWTDQKQNSLLEFQHQNLQDGVLLAPTGQRIYRAWTPQSTGKIQEITPTMEKKSSYWYMMNPGSGKNQTTSSTTGELQKQP